MFGQLEAEMEKRGLDTALVIGESTLGNPELLYVTGTTIPRGGIFLKRRHRDPVLVVSNIDVGSAKRGRIQDVRTYNDFGYHKLQEKHGPEHAYVRLIDSLLHSMNSHGKIAIYGRNEFSRLLSVADSLRRMGHKVTGEQDGSLFDSLRETKDRHEITRVRNVGLRAIHVVHGTLEMLRECTTSSGKLKHKRKTLTIGAVKSKIGALLADQGLMAPEGTTFAVGHSSADPHAMGEPSDPVRSGTPIVFDLFPVSPEGYWFDLTRTYVAGKPSPKVEQMFRAVLDVQLRSMDSIREGVPARQTMNLACDIFERNGFKTIRKTLKGDSEAARIGFIHSLGHGVGLTIGERPYLSLFSDDLLRKGHIVTVEPGLYRPGVGGVRIEDTVLVRGRRIENLTPLEKELKI